MCMRRTNAKRTLRHTQGWRGFSLIELLVVVAIILIIMAIAIPSFLRSKMAANEASAAEYVRAITTAATVYNTSWDNGYPPTLATLGGAGTTASCDQALLLDQLITAPPNTKSGYTFGYTGAGPNTAPESGCGAQGFNSYLTTAVPKLPGYTGQRSFCSTTPGVIHYNATGIAIASSAACNALPSLQ